MSLLAMFAFTASWAQRTVTGTVTGEEDGTPVPGVNVILKGSAVGTVTDIDGKYQISVPESGGILVFSFIGLATEEIVVGTQSVINMVMTADIRQLSEIVVVGYGTQSTRNNVQAVSTVKADAFANVPAVSPQQLLQGQAAGVQMVNSSGVLGSAANIRVRGAASISGGSSPLFVVDGVPLNDGGNREFSTAQGAGSALNPLLDLNPNDIESMTVLKDAAAVAIYGSRGANGVIIIKTKRGQDGKTRINFDYATGFSEPTNVLKYMNANQFGTFVNDWRAAAPGRGNAVNWPEEGFDWVDGVLQTGRINTYNLSMSGGSDKTQYFVGLGYHDEDGFTIGNSLERLSLRFNLDHKIGKRARAGVNFAISNTYSDRIGAENSTYAPLTSSYLQTPTVKPTDENGEYVNTGFIANVIAIEALNDNKFWLKRSVGSVYAEVDILKDLTFRSEAGIDLAQSEERYRDVDVLTPGGEGSAFVNQDNKWLITNTLNYQKDINKHSFGLLLGQAYETADNYYIGVAGTGFVSDQLRNVSSASVKSTTEANGTQWGISSLFSRFNYSFNNRYLLEASLRNDASSRFGFDKRNGTFWAVSGGWILSDESFLSNVNFVDFLKLTASVGTSGNDRIGNFNSLPLFGAGVAADYGGLPGLIPTQVPNPNLSWEETFQTDIGISTFLFKRRLGLDVNYYIKNTTGLLLNVPLPWTTGFSNRSENVGEMENRGWDIQLNATIIQKKDFRWTANLNVGFLKNEVLKLPENKDEDGRDFLAGSTAQRAIVGYTQNSFYLIRYKGVNPETGDAEWLKKNGEPTTTPLAADRVIVGSAIPDFTGGFSTTFGWKGIELMAFFNYSYGNKVLIDGLRFTENMGGTFNKSTDLLNYWKQPGDNAFAPRLDSPTAGAGQFSRLSTNQLLDGSYLRLKTLMLSYSLPRNVLESTKVLNSARFYVMAQNIWTMMDKDFRGPDPEVSANGANTQVMGESFFALPQPKMVTFGVNIGL